MNTEIIIENIDSELLSLHKASLNKSNYLFFDFHLALKSFIEFIPKENNISDYLRLKSKQYLDVFSDLLFTEEKSQWVEYISYDIKNRLLTVKEFTHFTNKVRLEERIVEKVEKDEHQHEYLTNNIEILKQERPEVFPVCKYHYLLENCNFIPIKEDSFSNDIYKWAWLKKFKEELNGMFGSFSFDIRTETTFEKYIEKLQFQKELMPPKPNKFNSSLQAHRLEKIKEWIYPDSLDKFLKIEDELLKGKYLDENYGWIKKKTELIEFLMVIKHHKILKPIVNGKKKQDFHYKQFISTLYGFGKSGLTETAKKHKPTLELAIIPFSWIKIP